MKSLLDVPNDERVPMTQEESEIFIKCCLAEKEKPDAPFEINDKTPFLMRIMDSWLAHTETQVTFWTALFVAMLSRTPGDVVMWVYTLNLLQKKNNKKVDTMDLAIAFLWGFPTEEGRNKIWKSQKTENGTNLLDKAETWGLEDGRNKKESA
jgi:hypothetical protein